MAPPKKKLPQWSFAVMLYSDNRNEGIQFKLLKVFDNKISAIGYADDLIRNSKRQRINEADDEDEEEELALRFAKPDCMTVEGALYDKYAHGVGGYFAARLAVQRVEVDVA